MIGHRDTEARSGPVARLILGLGIAGLLRLFPEVSLVGFALGRLYGNIVSLDAIVSILLVAGGIGLLRGKSWSAMISIIGAGAQLVTSIVWLVRLLPDIRFKSDMVFWPRMLFYVLSLTFLPYAGSTIMGQADRSSTPRKDLSERFLLGLCLVLGVAGGLFLNLLLIYLD